MRQGLLFLPLLAVFSSCLTFAASATHVIDTNVAQSSNAPNWIKASRVEKIADQIQDKLEWDIRKIHLHFYTDPVEFQHLHGFGAAVLAFTNKGENSVSIGPRVDDSNFDQVFGHELVHVILFQKYKNAVPAWLEEGMANYLSSKRWKVDYHWLSQQPHYDVLTLTHPFVGSSTGFQYHYQASQALMEMIAAHCSVTDLLQLSVGKKLESYLPTFCGITDINAEFLIWLRRKAGSAAAR